MASLNKVMLIGNLGKDPELQRFESGSTVARITLATNEAYKDKSGNRVEKTEWHSVSIWGKQAEIAEKYLKKGSLVFVEGRIRSSEYTDKNNVQRRFYEIACDRFRMLDRKQEGASTTSEAPVEAANVVTEEPVDDLPF